MVGFLMTWLISLKGDRKLPNCWTSMGFALLWKKTESNSSQEIVKYFRQLAVNHPVYRIKTSCPKMAGKNGLLLDKTKIKNCV